MPFMTDEDLGKELVRIRPDIPVILCTGYAELISKGIASVSSPVAKGRKSLLGPDDFDDPYFIYPATGDIKIPLWC